MTIPLNPLEMLRRSLVTSSLVSLFRFSFGDLSGVTETPVDGTAEVATGSAEQRQTPQFSPVPT